MKRYEALTKYLYILEIPGERELRNFTDDIYAFVDHYPEYELNNYIGILKENNIEWGISTMQSADVSILDGKAVLALLVGAVRAERFSDGILQIFVKDRQIHKWLTKLKELDEE